MFAVHRRWFGHFNRITTQNRRARKIERAEIDKSNEMACSVTRLVDCCAYIQKNDSDRHCNVAGDVHLLGMKPTFFLNCGQSKIMRSTALQTGQQATGVVATNEFLELWMAFLGFTTCGMIQSSTLVSSMFSTFWHLVSKNLTNSLHFGSLSVGAASSHNSWVSQSTFWRRQ